MQVEDGCLVGTVPGKLCAVGVHCKIPPELEERKSEGVRERAGPYKSPGKFSLDLEQERETGRSPTFSHVAPV